MHGIKLKERKTNYFQLTNLTASFLQLLCDKIIYPSFVYTLSYLQVRYRACM